MFAIHKHDKMCWHLKKWGRGVNAKRSETERFVGSDAILNLYPLFGPRSEICGVSYKIAKVGLRMKAEIDQVIFFRKNFNS